VTAHGIDGNDVSWGRDGRPRSLVARSGSVGLEISKRLRFRTPTSGQRLSMGGAGSRASHGPSAPRGWRPRLLPAGPGPGYSLRPARHAASIYEGGERTDEREEERQRIDGLFTAPF